MMKDIDYVIARGEICDIDSIIQFQADMAMESEGTTLDLEKVAKGVTAAMNDDSKGIYWVAKADGKAIGSLMLTREWSDWNNEWYWWIQSVYVVPEYRKHGIYKAMYSTLKEVAKENSIEIVENKPLARMLYANVEVGQAVPPELYQAVAEVLAFVYKLQGRI